LGESIKGTAV